MTYKWTGYPKQIHREKQKMARTGWILVTSCLVALVASQNCPDQDSSLKKWSDEATWNGQVYVYTGILFYLFLKETFNFFFIHLIDILRL